MRKIRLLELLKSYEYHEWNDFGLYHRRHYSDSSDEYKLYQYIKSKRKKLMADELSLIMIKEKLFPLSPQKYVQNTMSRLSQRVEAYFIQVEIDLDEDERQLRLFSALNRRGLYAYADKKAERLRKEWKRPPIMNHENLLYLLRLNHAHYLSNNPIKKSKSIDLLSELIISYNGYKYLMFEYYQFVLQNVKSFRSSNEDEYSFNNDNTIFKNQENILSTIKNLKNILHDSEKSFNSLFEELLSKDHKYSDELAIIVFDKCRSYLTKKVSLGDFKYVANLLSIFELGIQRKYLLYNNTMSSVLFYNLFSTACALNKIEWAKSYLNNYIDLIPNEDKKLVKYLADAEIHFVNCSYVKALSILNKIEMINISLRVHQKFLLLSSYFVIYDNYDFINSQINNYNQFFYYNKNKMSLILFESALNLGKVIRQLVSKYSGKISMDQIKQAKHLAFRLRLPTIIEQRKIYVKKHGLN